RTGVWRLVPAPLARLLGQTNQPQLATRSPSAVLWWSHEGTIGRREAFVCSLLGANGFETDLTPRLVRSSTGAVVYAATGALPVSQKRLRGRVGQRTSTNLVALGEFSLPNPLFGMSRPLISDPIGSTKRDGDFEARLVAASTGVPMSTIGSVGSARVKSPGTEIAFAIKSRGVPAHDWNAWSTSVTNAAGLFESAIVGPRSGIRVSRAPALWPTEVYSVWVTFAQSLNSKFDPEDQWVVQGIAVPAPGDFAEANASTERHGVNVRVRGIVRGAVTPRPRFTSG